MIASDTEAGRRESRQVWCWVVALVGMLTGGAVFALVVVALIIGAIAVWIFLGFQAMGDPCGALGDLYFGSAC